MVNETIVRIAIAIGLSPTVVSIVLAFASGGLLALAGERYAISRKRFKPPTPNRARDTAYILGAGSLIPVAVFAGIGLEAVAVVAGAVGLFFGFQYVRGDVPFGNRE